MKIYFNAKSMLDAFAIVSSVAPPKSPRPVLSNIHLSVAANGIAELSATDLEVAISHRVLGVRCDTPGSVLLAPQRFRPILTTANDSEMTLSVQADDKLRIQGTKSEFNLTSENPATFPAVPAFSAESYYVVAAGDLKRAIRRTMPCCDPASTRYALGGVLFELTATSLRCVGTDGRRLAQQDSAAEAEGEPTTPPSPVIPQKALKLLDKILDDGNPPVHIAVNANAIMFRTEAAIVYSRLVEGRFPKYQDVFPKAHEVSIPLNVGTLHEAVDQASITTSDESRGVDFDFNVGVLRLKATASDVGTSEVELEIPHEGKAVEITFDPKYLTDALKTLEPEAGLTLELIDGKSAAIFRTEDRYSVVIMPLSRDR